MKLSYQWLNKYIDLRGKSASDIEDALTMIGFEVEGVDETGLPPLENVVVGEVVSRDQHPNADRLSVCEVRIDDEGNTRRIVCGAQNHKVGDRVPVALVGAVLPGNFKIKKSKLRGEVSEGMMCSARELGAGDDAAGLLILEQRPPPGMPINEVFPDNDTIFDVEITPNRPDCLSHVGIARELAAVFGLDLLYPELKHNFDDHGTASPDVFCKLTVESDDCPFYTAHVIRDVRVGPSPDWLQRDLRAVGLRPINNVVDITNYVLLELGQPLHAFDAAKIKDRRLIIRQALEGEKIVTLDEKERALHPRMLVIADVEKPLVVAGVMGSVDAAVDEETVDVVLESAHFRTQSIRWTSRRLGLGSDSSYRFERGIDPGNVVFAAQRAADLILDIAGGQLAGPVMTCGGVTSIRNEIHLTRPYLSNRCGFEIEDSKVEEIFSALELSATSRINDRQETEWTVEVPSFRSDLDSPIDLVEEVIRINGTNNIPAAPVTSTGLERRDDPVYRFNAKASSYLVGQHFAECLNYSLRSGDELKAWFSQAAADKCALANPLSSDQTHLRWSLIPGLLDNLKLNQSRKTGLKRIFECGHIFRERDGVLYEMAAVGFLISHDERSRSWRTPAKPDFYTAKTILASLAQLAGHRLGDDLRPVSGSISAWLEGHSAEAGDLMESFEARMGLLDPQFLSVHDVEGDVIAGILEIRLDKVADDGEIRRFTPFSLFPAAERDLALLADANEPAETVRQKLAGAAAKSCGDAFSVEEVRVFDLYEGKGMPEGKKSLGFTLIFRSPERTLTDGEVNAAFTATRQLMAEAGYETRQ